MEIGCRITANGALIYVTAALSPYQLAQLLVRARVIRGMELDINSSWPDYSTYDPPWRTASRRRQTGASSCVNRASPWTFFESTWPRDFITMSARSKPLKNIE